MDGKQMKSIALLTMVFLPATFIAVSCLLTLFDCVLPNPLMETKLHVN